jgi:hypothetical protein
LKQIAEAKYRTYRLDSTWKIPIYGVIMARKILDSTGNNFQFFKKQEDLEEVLRLAKTNMPIKAIADWFGCSYQTISTNEVVLPFVKRGWAEYRERIERELFTLATIDLKAVEPDQFDTYASMKQKALNTIHKVLHADPYVPPQEVERVRRLSDEELKIELERAAALLPKAIQARTGTKSGV